MFTLLLCQIKKILLTQFQVHSIAWFSRETKKVASGQTQAWEKPDSSLLRRKLIISFEIAREVYEVYDKTALGFFFQKDPKRPIAKHFYNTLPDNENLSLVN